TAGEDGGGEQRAHAERASQPGTIAQRLKNESHRPFLWQTHPGFLLFLEPGFMLLLYPCVEFLCDVGSVRLQAQIDRILLGCPVPQAEVAVEAGQAQAGDRVVRVMEYTRLLGLELIMPVADTFELPLRGFRFLISSQMTIDGDKGVVGPFVAR